MQQDQNNIWTSWFNHAKDFAGKAQELAETAGKIAQEKAAVLAKQAQDLRQNYDMEVAASILMGTIAAPSESLDAALKSADASVSTSTVLDLDYITENLITMAFPFDPARLKSGETGNDINAVSAFLGNKHAGRFMIWNISEEAYDYSKFSDQVLEYKFPGHPAPPLGILFKICTSVESWLDADESNVAVVHCLTGKGRTAALVACILTWIGEFNSPVEALQYIAERRAMSVEQITIPSQRRYVQYFSNILDGVRPRSEPLLLRRVIMNTIPTFDLQGQGCCPYIQLFKNGKLIATASALVEGDSSSREAAAEPKPSKAQLRWINKAEGSASFSVDCPIQGDILLRCRHAASSGARVSMFRAGFHTGYVPSGVLRLTKAQLDGSNADPRYDDDFFIDLIFAPVIVSNSDNESGHVTGAGSASDSGILIDAVSTDKYEASLHKDARFWESIATRKTRGKKRRPRKFVSAQQEQFSISDDAGVNGKGSDSPNTNEISFLSTQAALLQQQQQQKASALSSLSDMELILQLAQAEDSSTATKDAPSLASTSAAAAAAAAVSDPLVVDHPLPVVPKGVMELQALEELEKELGLGDLNFLTTSSAAIITSTTAATSSSSSSTTSSSSNSGVCSSDSNGKEAAGVVSAASPAKSSVIAAAPPTKAQQQEEDDDNLDELEKYLQSLSAN